MDTAVLVALGIDAELVVVAGEDGVEQDARQGGDGQAGERDGGAGHGEGDAAGEARPHTRMTAAMMRLRDLVRSTLFSTMLRTPMAEIMP